MIIDEFPIFYKELLFAPRTSTISDLELYVFILEALFSLPCQG